MADRNEFLDELNRISRELRPFHDRLFEGIDDAKGTFQERAKAWARTLTNVEHVFERMFTFLHAVIINAGDVFGHVDFMIENKKAFKAIGAIGCLQALENLMPFYEEQKKLPTDEQDEYWQRTIAARESAESLAEGCNEFGRLLLAYTRNHADQFGRSARVPPT